MGYNTKKNYEANKASLQHPVVVSLQKAHEALYKLIQEQPKLNTPNAQESSEQKTPQAIDPTILEMQSLLLDTLSHLQNIDLFTPVNDSSTQNKCEYLRRIEREIQSQWQKTAQQIEATDPLPTEQDKNKGTLHNSNTIRKHILEAINTTFLTQIPAPDPTQSSKSPSIANVLQKMYLDQPDKEDLYDACTQDLGSAQDTLSQLFQENVTQALTLYSNHFPSNHWHLVQALYDAAYVNIPYTTNVNTSPHPYSKWSLESAYEHAGCQLSQQDKTLLHLVEENQKIYDTHFEKYMEADEKDNPTITCDNIWTIFCPPNSIEHRKKVTDELKDELSAFAKQAQKQIQDSSPQLSPRSVANNHNTTPHHKPKIRG